MSLVAEGALLPGELPGCRLLAEHSKPIPQWLNTEAGDEPYSRLTFNCPMQLIHYFEKEIIALLPFSAHILSHPIPSLAVQLGFFFFFLKRMHLISFCSKKAQNLIFIYDQDVLEFFHFASIALKLRDLYYIFLIVRSVFSC